MAWSHLHSPERSIGMLRGRRSGGHASLCCRRCQETVAKSWRCALLWPPSFIKAALHCSINISLLSHNTHDKKTHKTIKNSLHLFPKWQRTSYNWSYIFSQYIVSPNSELHSATPWGIDQHFSCYSSTAFNLCCNPNRRKKVIGVQFIAPQYWYIHRCYLQ